MSNTLSATSPIAVIPARGGSQAIPRKNLCDLGGKPLVAWTIEAALAADVQPLVSSDDSEILEVGATHGAAVLERSAELGDHDVHAIHVILEALDHIESHVGLPDAVLMLLPTSPFRTADDIRQALGIHRERQPPSVVSVSLLDKQMIHLRTIDENDALVPLAPWDQLTAQRQQQLPLYGLNGSIYVADPRVLRENGTFHVPGAVASIMPAEHSIDINEPSDLEYARYLLGGR